LISISFSIASDPTVHPEVNAPAFRGSSVQNSRDMGHGMGQDIVIRTLLGLCAAVLVLAALSLAQTIFAPVAFALFVIAIAWPFQNWLQQRIPKLLALAVTIFVIFIIITVMGWLMIWGFSKIAQWLINNAVRFQILYAQATEWLEGHGISLASQIVDNFNFSWALRAVQEVLSRLHGMTSFVVITFVFVLLGMLEVDITKRNIARLKNQTIARSLVEAGTEIAAKFQKYMLVRSVMSFLTGAVIWLVALFAGLELATAWGVIAFVLNYIPFLGPLVATVFPTLFAFAQFESWQLAIVIFVSLNLVQFLIGSYFEPRFAGATLAVSPFLILLAVFFWTFLWGIAGAFIGVPIVIAILTLCEQHDSTRWVSDLLSGRDDVRA
jgi:AI-2 transport protein TqsA